MSSFRWFLSLFSVTCWLSLTAFAGQMRGVVLTPDGQPVENGAVRVLDYADYYADPVISDLQIDKNGGFAFEIDPEPSTENGRFVTAIIAVPGLATQSARLHIGNNEIRLRIAKPWSGVILDSQQKPVASVKIRLLAWHDGKEFSTMPKEQAPSAVTDANGHYSFDNLPATGQASFAIDDAHFDATPFLVDLSDNEAPPFFVKPGASVTGRLVTSEGEPLAGVDIVPGFHYNDAVKTASDGRFVIPGLQAGSTNLSASSGLGGWSVTALDVENIRTGEQRKLPDWVASRGPEITGQVIDAASKKALEGMQLKINQAGAASTKTDATGHFKFFAPSSTRRTILGGTVSEGTISGIIYGPGYVSKTVKGLSVPKDVTTVDLGVFTLERGVRFSGVVRDEKGEKLPTGDFRLGNANSTPINVQGQDGVFAVGAVAPGHYYLTSASFEVISPKTLDFTLDRPQDAVEVVLRHKFDLPRQQFGLEGRVVDAEGQPLAGAQVTFKTSGFGLTSIVSGSDGRFHIKDIPSVSTPTVESIERPGFVFWKGGEMTRAENEWQTNLVMTPAGQTLRGQVVDDHAEPVVGAWIAVLGDKKRPPVQTDAQGTFALPDVPSDEISLATAQGLSYGVAKVRGDSENAVITLAAPAPVDANALADTLVTGKPAPASRLMNKSGESLGDERLEKMALRSDGSLDETGRRIFGKNGHNLRLLFQYWERQNPELLLQRGPDLISLFNNGPNKRTAEAILAHVQAQFGDQEEKKLAMEWLDREKKVQREADSAAVLQYLSMAAVASSLKLPEANAWLDTALTTINGLSDETKMQNAATWGGAAAAIDITAVDPLLAVLSPPLVVEALGGAIERLTRSGDVDNAQVLLEQIVALQTDPQVVASAKDETWTILGLSFQPASLLSAAQGKVAVALATRDAPAAWKLVDSINPNSKASFLLPLADAARRSGNKEVALEAVRALFDLKWVPTDSRAQAASIAYMLDPKLGNELFTKAREQSVPRWGNFESQPSVAIWAFYNAPRDPGLSRILLENEWSWRFPVSQAETKGIGIKQNAWAVPKLAFAMSVLDPGRALEWADLATDETGDRAFVKARIVAALLATPEQRATFDLAGD